ncbi:MAG: hypothetical protein KF774_05870 [Planctomyces sp.]|nr:hypothetical protein [Planctomyces sp.]
MTPSELPIIAQAARCRNLLSKGLYINAGLPADQHVTGDGNVWCGKTQTVFGPDRSVCDVEACTDPARKCYVAP